jgi:hypothetical protein
MAKYRKKPVVIEAIQFNGENQEAIIDFTNGMGRPSSPTAMSIFTLEGIMLAGINDYIIKGVHGEFYPCKEEIFEKTYEPVE